MGMSNCSAISVESSTIFSDLLPNASTGVVATISRGTNANGVVPAGTTRTDPGAPSMAGCRTMVPARICRDGIGA